MLIDMTAPSQRVVKRIRWWWIALAAGVGLVVFGLASIDSTSCFDSPEPGGSYCTSVTLIPKAALLFVLVAYGLCVVFCVYRAFRRDTK